MIAEKIPNKSSFGRKGFTLPIRYVARDEVDSGKEIPILMGQVNLDMDINTAEDRELMAMVMNTTAQRAKRLQANPISHWTINWMENEHPDQKQITQVVKASMSTLGMQNCQAFWAFHQDTDNDHIHLIINRALPDGSVVKEPRRDYLLMDRAMRELEIQQGWNHAHGPWMVRETPEGEKNIIRMSRKERRELGMLKEDKTTQAARHARHHQAAPSFQEWVSTAPAESLHATLLRPDATWENVHATLAGYGIRIEPRHNGDKGGLVLTSTIGDRAFSAKASQMGRWASRGALEKKMGPFEPVGDVTRLPQLREHYGRFLKRFQGGAEGKWERKKPEHETGHIHQDDKKYRHDPAYQATREARRAERTKAREDLYRRFQDEQEWRRSMRREARDKLREDHQLERQQLREDLHHQRKDCVQGLHGTEARLALSLYAFEAAKMRETLQKRQAAERKSLLRERLASTGQKVPKGTVWREWLETQAEAGDSAAQAALRGIRYREQRESKQKQNGIEGEELADFAPVLTDLQPEIDQQEAKIIYRNGDGTKIFTDTGPRIDVHESDETSLEAALRVAAQKYGGKVDITGSAEFREQAARMATRLGIDVIDADMATIVEDEKAKARFNWKMERKVVANPEYACEKAWKRLEQYVNPENDKGLG